MHVDITIRQVDSGEDQYIINPTGTQTAKDYWPTLGRAGKSKAIVTNRQEAAAFAQVAERFGVRVKWY